MMTKLMEEVYGPSALATVRLHGGKTALRHVAMAKGVIYGGVVGENL